MYCTKCGSAIAADAAFCASCGQAVAGLGLPAPGVSQPAIGIPPAPASYPAPPSPPAVWQAAPVSSGNVYVPLPSPFAGFWLRFVAWIIDSILIVIGFGMIALIIFGVVGAGFFEGAFENSDSADAFLPFAAFLIIMIGALSLIVGCWVYYAWMESSHNQGTLGKMALGLIVTDLQGRRVTFARATGRFFAKIITGLIPFYIGYIMAGFTEKKQALHDMIASCLVLRRS